MATDIAGAPAPAFPFGSLRERLKTRTEQSLSAEEAAGRRLAMMGRNAALVVIALLLAVVNPYPGFLYYEALLGLFLVVGAARYVLERRGSWQGWHDYLLIGLDFALLTFTLLYPNPLAPFDYPAQMSLRFGNFVYFYVLLAGLAFGFQPRRVVWGGIIGALAWLSGIVWLIALPDTVVFPSETGTFDSELAILAMPTLVDLDMVTRDLVVFLIIAGMVALVVARSRRLVERQALLERERGNLARYFPPATVDRLARQDAALASIRETDAAVLFFDLVGFTHWAERHSPAEVIKMLREMHGRVENAVFAHDGTLDKFIGDGAMATFGAVDPGPREATNALACAVAIVDEFKAWNARRTRSGQAQVRASVGVHYGPVVVGNIGTDRRIELAALGDAVNVASRLEALTRDLDCGAAISSALADAASEETGDEAAALLARFRAGGQRELRGRDEAVDVLAYG